MARLSGSDSIICYIGRIYKSVALKSSCVYWLGYILTTNTAGSTHYGTSCCHLHTQA